MSEILHELIERSALRTPDAAALSERGEQISYASLATAIAQTGAGLIAAGAQRGDRVAVYLPKQTEAVVGYFAASRAGAAFVPVNPLLKPAQVGHILRDCGVRILITSAPRAAALADELTSSPALKTLVIVGDVAGADYPGTETLAWSELTGDQARGRRVIDTDLAAVLYTSGSTGKPKGVMLSHRNMVCGAVSVASYLNNVAQDRLLTVLPFSFDYGFSQLTTAFSVGATAVLFEYLLPRDVIRAVEREQITGLAGVPPLWMQLAGLPWSDAAAASLRYITNSGGAMPQATLKTLREVLGQTEVFLMYGLTEAFRSTYLDPGQLDDRPSSMGKAIPNADILVVRPDGTPCAPNEPGELVHRGSLVAMGYWNDAERTALRFRPSPVQPEGATIKELAVWSGDTVRCDEDGFLYFVGRRDEMIKTSGYRVSPAEIEEVVYGIAGVSEVIAFGVPHEALGQAIVAVVVADQTITTADAVLNACRKVLPGFMLPSHIEFCDDLPRNPNGKIDRPAVAARFQTVFESLSA